MTGRVQDKESAGQGLCRIRRVHDRNGARLGEYMTGMVQD